MSRRFAVVSAVAAATVLAFPLAASAAAPSLTLAPAGVIGSAGRTVSVSGTYRCDFVPGGTQRLMVKVVQSNPFTAQAQNIFVVPCTGAVLPYAFTLPVISAASMLPGPATGQALLNGSSGAVAVTTPMVLA